MAQLTPPAPRSGFRIENLAPFGQHVAVCLEVQDLFGVERTKFQSQETELKDVTRFLFGFIDQTGQPHIVQTYEFTISGGSNSNLVKFLTSWLGQAPEYGWDYCELKGSGALLSVEHVQSKGTPPVTYAKISGIFPTPQQMLAHVPGMDQFNDLVASAQVESGKPAQAPIVPPAQPPVVPPMQPPVNPPVQPNPAPQENGFDQNVPF